MKNNLLYCITFLCFATLYSQEQEGLKVDTVQTSQEKVISQSNYNPLAPSKAAFYSAVLPGLGQAYNKKYWKIPIIYAGMATGVYFYIQNNNDYNNFRDAYKRRLAGFTDDQYYGDGETPEISNDRLIDAQQTAQRNKNVSLLVVIGFYMLNIVDANVDAHLRQFNVSEDLSITPNLGIDSRTTKTQYGLSFTYTLK